MMMKKKKKMVWKSWFKSTDIVSPQSKSRAIHFHTMHLIVKVAFQCRQNFEKQKRLNNPHKSTFIVWPALSSYYTKIVHKQYMMSVDEGSQKVE